MWSSLYYCYCRRLPRWLSGEKSTCQAGDGGSIWAHTLWRVRATEPSHSCTGFYTLQLELIFPGGSVSKESACDAGDLGLILGLGRSPGEGHDSPLQYSCLENSMNKGAWQATVHGVARVGHNLATKPPPPQELKPWGQSKSQVLGPGKPSIELGGRWGPMAPSHAGGWIKTV